MSSEYIISKWAMVRRNELVDVPETFEIHEDFLNMISFEEFEAAFKEVHDIFYQIYTDISCHPERFGFALYKHSEYHYFSKEAREARSKPWDIFYFMLYMFDCAEFRNNICIIDAERFRSINKVKKISFLIEALSDYGFIFIGLKDNKIASSLQYFEIDYPDNRNVLIILSLAAQKVMAAQLKNIKNHFSSAVVFSNGFISWNHKVFKDDLTHCNLAEGIDYVSDKLHKKEEQAFVEIMNKILIDKGLSTGKGDNNEGPSIRYYGKESKSTYQFAITVFEGDLMLELRIRNAEKCMEYLKGCPDRILDIFKKTDKGCQNRINGTCKCGVKYVFEDEEKWHCGCYCAPFRIYPVKEEIPHYLKLVELGNKR
jgi:hypothetical protein